MKTDPKKIRTKIEASLKQTGEYSEKQCNDIAFHLTDWSDELFNVFNLYQNPDKFQENEIIKILMDFLIHAPNHIVAAAKLMTGLSVEDIFDVNVIETNKK